MSNNNKKDPIITKEAVKNLLNDYMTEHLVKNPKYKTRWDASDLGQMSIDAFNNAPVLKLFNKGEELIANLLGTTPNSTNPTDIADKLLTLELGKKIIDLSQARVKILADTINDLLNDQDDTSHKEDQPNNSTQEDDSIVNPTDDSDEEVVHNSTSFNDNETIYPIRELKNSDWNGGWNEWKKNNNGKTWAS